jgi:hypothetical protein
VGCRGGSGTGAGLTALTAASFCVFLTLELTESFLAAALRATGFGAALLALTAGFALAATFFEARALSGLRAGGFAAVARFALGLVEDFALTARFAVGLSFERDADRLNPFVRLLLMCGSQKAAHPVASSRRNRRELTTGPPLNQ